MAKQRKIGTKNKPGIVLALKKLIDQEYAGSSRSFAQAVHRDVTFVSRALTNNVKLTDEFLKKLKDNTGAKLLDNGTYVMVRPPEQKPQPAPIVRIVPEPEPSPEPEKPTTTFDRVFAAVEAMNKLSAEDEDMLEELVAFRLGNATGSAKQAINAIQDVLTLKNILRPQN